MLELHRAPFSEEQIQLARDFDASVLQARGYHAFNEAVRRDIDLGGSTNALLVTNRNVAGYAWHVDTDSGHWEVTLAHVALVDPDAMYQVGAYAVHAAKEHGASTVVAWAPGDDELVRAVLTEIGFQSDRVLLQLRVDLPLAANAKWDEAVTVRRFDPALDTESFLAVNNAAFAGHPEQGGWDDAALHARLAQPWFDPDGFLVAIEDSKVIGFIWMKLHTRETVPQPIGEIYAVGVDPAQQGRGVGRALALTGLAWAAAHVDTGMLYVDAANQPAVKMYQSMGFFEHHRTHALTLDLPL
ncbi:MAG: mycothiol synthase [Acidimicrobiia bacterium]